MINRSNKHISDALMITDDLMGSVGNQSGVADEVGYIIVFGLIRDCICKIRHQPEIQERKVKKVRKHTNAILVVFAAAALLIFSAPSVKANIILLTDFPETLGGPYFTNRNLIEYNLSTNVATLYFDEGLFSNNADINAVHELPEPATIAILGLGMLVLILNRHRITHPERALCHSKIIQTGIKSRLLTSLNLKGENLSVHMKKRSRISAL